MGSKNKSFNTKIRYGDGETYQTSTVFTVFADVIEIKPPAMKANEVDVTVLDTPDEMVDAEPSLADNDPATFKLRWLRAQTPTIMSMFRVKKGFDIVYPDAPFPSGSKLKFTGWISQIEHENLTRDGLCEATVTVRVVGKPQMDLVP